MSSEIASQPRLAADGQRGTVPAIHYTLSYIAKGTISPTAPVAVLLHGFPGDATVWQPVLSSLPMPAMAFDLLGFGQSSHPWTGDTSVWGHADALNLALRNLDLTQIVLVGYGLGGGIAQILATRLMPELVKGLVLIDSIAYQYSFAPDWPLPEMEKRRDPEAPRHTSMAELEQALRATIPNASVKPDNISGSVLDSYVKPWLNELDKEILFQQIRQLTPYYLNAVASDLPRLTVPTSIIWGERDSVMSVKLGQRLNRAIPGSTLTVIPGAGHLILNDAGPQVGKALADFLGSFPRA